MMKAQVYILHSEKLNKFYIGLTTNLQERLQKHKDKVFENAFTSNADDWSLFWCAEELNVDTARNIEAHIKRMKSKIYIQNLTKYPGIIEKLILRYS